MKPQPGDHVCSVYETDEQLVTIVATFVADGLARGERCWYVPSGSEIHAVWNAIEQRGIDVDEQARRTALRLLDSNDTYTVRGGFDPEQTMRVFSDAIEQALTDGFTGFRAAAEMSWVLQIKNGAESLIAYEAMLRVLFSTARATGLCLYNRRRMPMRVVNGALLTHPFIASDGESRRNAVYDPAVRALADIDPTSNTPQRRIESATRRHSR